METAIVTLQSVLGQDLKPTDIEVAMVTTDDPKFRVLSVKEIDEYLQRCSRESGG